MTKVKDLVAQLEQVIAKLKDLKEKGGYTSDEITGFQDKIRAIDEMVSGFDQWNDGAIKEDDGSIAPGQADLSDDLNDAHELIADLLDTLPDDE